MEGQPMRRVIMESPYAGDVEANVAYARACLRDCLERGEAPIASHLLYTQPGVLQDGNPFERQWGIEAGLTWSDQAEAAVFYVDRGWSAGMRLAKAHHLGRITVEERTLPGYVAPEAHSIRKLMDEIDEDAEMDWIEFTQIGSDFEQRMSRTIPVRYQHRPRGQDEWLEGRPPK
jgi:hypothetical protein